MANGDIPDSSITASSYRKHADFDRLPRYARLGGVRFWMNDKKNDTKPWIQVDLVSSHNVTGLKAEGNDAGGVYKYWVEQIKVQVGVAEGDLTFIEDTNGQPKVC